MTYLLFLYTKKAKKIFNNLHNYIISLCFDEDITSIKKTAIKFSEIVD